MSYFFRSLIRGERVCVRDGARLCERDCAGDLLRRTADLVHPGRGEARLRQRGRARRCFEARFGWFRYAGMTFFCILSFLIPEENYLGYYDYFCECEWQEKVAGHGYVSANAGRRCYVGPTSPQTFSANFFRQLFLPEVFGHESGFIYTNNSAPPRCGFYLHKLSGQAPWRM